MADGSDRKKPGLGSGGMWLGVAKLWFLVASYAVTLALTRLLSPTEWGQYATVSKLIAVPNMVIIYTLLFSVSRPLAAEHKDGFPSYDALRARGQRMALVLGGLTCAVYFFGAPLFAGNDPDIAGPIRIVAPISLVYALYAVNIGTINAVRRFRRQAVLDIAMATMKTTFIVAAAAMGLGLTATCGGFTLASVLAFVLSLAMVSSLRPAVTTHAVDRNPAQPAQKESLTRYTGALVGFTAVVNLLQSADVIILSRLAYTSVEKDAVGFYASAQQVALVPYSLMNALALLMFPLIASLDAAREPARVRAYARETAKVCALLLAFMAAVASASASDVQALLFPKAYGAAADELRLLVWGFSGFSFAVTVAWVFNSTKRARTAMVLVVVPLVIVVGLSFALVPSMFTTGQAIAVAVAGGVAVVLALVALWRSLGAGIPVFHLLKLAAAVAAVEVVARLWPVMSTAGLVGKLFILVKLGVLAVVFLGVVAVTRAVTLREIKELRRAA